MKKHENDRIPDGLGEKQLGVYGKMRRDVLFYCERAQYDALLASGELLAHCRYVEQTAIRMRKDIEKQYAGYDSLAVWDIAEGRIRSWIGYYKLEER